LDYFKTKITKSKNHEINKKNKKHIIYNIII